MVTELYFECPQCLCKEFVLIRPARDGIFFQVEGLSLYTQQICRKCISKDSTGKGTS